jgi:hypothetical protein
MWERPALKDLLVHKDRRVSRVFKASKASRALKASRDQPVLKGMLVRLDLKV